ncbi:hemolysin family protein [Salinithrix halophila]|uniref:Hemolysin family protein n=1 Tax=Salinithrix halophila TaxID=1485204 RepID=A0ABV8JGM5_9BACL
MEDVLSLLFLTGLMVMLILLNGFCAALDSSLTRTRSNKIPKRTAALHNRSSNRETIRSTLRLGVVLSSLFIGWIAQPAVEGGLFPFVSPVIPKWVLHPLGFALLFGILAWPHLTARHSAAGSGVFARFEASISGAISRLYKEPPENSGHHKEETHQLEAHNQRSNHVGVAPYSTEHVYPFVDRLGREIMVPRVDMVCLYTDNTFEENQAIIRQHRHTRYPLCEKDKDRILGVVHIHDIYEYTQTVSHPSFVTIARPEVSVPETMELTQILRTLQEKRAGMAIVVDEYGGTAGLVTKEDIMEEVFGEIQDEFDQSPPLFLPKGEATSIHPRALIEEVNDHFGVSIDDPDNDTIGGWLFSCLEKVPEKGDRIIFGGLEFMVVKARDRWIDRVLVRRIDTLADSPVVKEKRASSSAEECIPSSVS